MAGIFKDIIDVIGKSRRLLVVTHVNPEGDAMGSLFGMTLALRKAGKEAVCYMEEPVPEPFGFLPGSETAVHALENEAPFDATIAVDCGELDRLGAGFVAFKDRGVLINLDHHISNDNFGDLNVVLPEHSSAGEVVYDLLTEAGMEVGLDVATNLYVAILTDTGCFRYSSATAESFEKAAALVRLGIKPQEISTLVFESNPVRKYKLLAMVLATLDADAGGVGGRVATVYMTDKMLEETGSSRSDADGFVNYTRSIKGVEVGVMLREAGPGKVKVSLRSKPPVDVAAVAGEFGGGGHVNAAGCTVDGTIEEAMEKVLSVLKEKAFSTGGTGGSAKAKGRR